MLSVKDLHVHYGAIHAIKGVSLTVGDGEIVSLIGANGAGKTTILRTISNLNRATSGEVMLDKSDLRKVDPNRIISMGLAHVPEGRHVFSRMTVLENLKMGAYSLKDKARVDANVEMVFKSFPRLRERGQAGGGHAFRRRAADAGHRPRADDEPQDPLDGRAVDGPFADPGEGDLPDHRFAPPGGASRSFWSSRTPEWRCRCPTGRTYWRPAPS